VKRLALIGLAVLALAGCGSSTTTTVIHAAPRAAVVHRHTVIVQQIVTQTVTAPSPTPAPTTDTPTPGLRSCDQNISANVVTSCIFAKNVFVAYYVGYENYGQQASTTVVAYSPIARISYNENCYSDGTTINCSNGSNFVTFPLWAIQVYVPR
jgi:hypothetical protein